MSPIRKRLIALLDKIEDLFQNNAKIQSELIQILFDLENPKPDIEDVLGIKVYLGSDYKESGNLKIGEEIPSPFTEEPFAGCNGHAPPNSPNVNVSGSIPVQDCAGNLLTIEPREPSPSEIESQYIHSTTELWR